MPDLRGLFLRGYGSQSYAQNNGSTVGYTSTTHSSGELGQVQGDAIRNITGSSGFFKDYDNSGDRLERKYEGAIFEKSAFNSQGGGGSNSSTNYNINIDVSYIVPTANENRPANTAVRYLVRARP